MALAMVMEASDADAIYALVTDPQQIAFLQLECRLYGSPDGVAPTAAAAPPRLRLALEEMALGVVKGFLRLETPGVDSTVYGGVEEKSRTLVDQITEELRGDAWQREDIDGDGVTWRLCTNYLDTC